MFAHLHCHNEFSVLDGYGTAKQYAEAAAKKGFKHLAITNHGNIDGWPDHQKQCLAANIRPVFGCEFYIVEDALQRSEEHTSELQSHHDR
jgi:DNA polymerase-3 subunit alpha